MKVYYFVRPSPFTSTKCGRQKGKRWESSDGRQVSPGLVDLAVEIRVPQWNNARCLIILQFYISILCGNKIKFKNPFAHLFNSSGTFGPLQTSVLTARSTHGNKANRGARPTHGAPYPSSSIPQCFNFRIKGR